MSTFNDSETADVSPSENHANPSVDPGHTESQASCPDDGNSKGEAPTLEMNRCPECGARRFVSKLLVYEVTSYDESGEQEFRRQHVRAEFEFTCSECQTTLRTLPADRRDYYDEVDVLEAEGRLPSGISSDDCVSELAGGSGLRNCGLCSSALLLSLHRSGCSQQHREMETVPVVKSAMESAARLRLRRDSLSAAVVRRVLARRHVRHPDP